MKEKGIWSEMVVKPGFPGFTGYPKSGMLTSLYEQKCEQATVFLGEHP
ncbi:hypothetical protein [Paenibacillus favisporus]|nr:hypothetical protein [Paenibacillus favisporus]